MEIRVNKKEQVYFALKVIFTIVVLVGLVAFLGQLISGSTAAAVSSVTVILVYGFFIWLFLVFQKIFLVGYLKGNGVEITEDQFPDTYHVYLEMNKALGIRKVPPLFIIQQGGALNAFAVKFSGKNYIAIYSDIFEMIHTEREVVKFVLAHELGHVKRNHMSKQFWTFLSSLIPFLSSAYSRSCEYTCDNIGHDLSVNGSIPGLLVLASGKTLYKEIDVKKYIENSKKQRGFVVWFTEICSSHPFLPKRLVNVQSV